MLDVISLVDTHQSKELHDAFRFVYGTEISFCFPLYISIKVGVAIAERKLSSLGYYLSQLLVKSGEAEISDVESDLDLNLLATDSAPASRLLSM